MKVDEELIASCLQQKLNALIDVQEFYFNIFCYITYEENLYTVLETTVETLVETFSVYIMRIMRTILKFHYRCNKPQLSWF